MTTNINDAETIKIDQRKNIKKVLKSYFKWLLATSSFAVIAFFLANYINHLFPLAPLWIRIMQIGSIVLEAAALGQCGWDIQTWDGNSPAEILNKRLSKALSLIGLFAILISFQLETKLDHPTTPTKNQTFSKPVKNHSKQTLPNFQYYLHKETKLLYYPNLK